ncbi:fibronectin type III domain-containing protein [Ligilactobacillus acidipiscis]|uniref:fibronectin type III domain-containing protein n=1 Tax=Ligilactobacillus acidipiscis TaxID=89059 RepID=UPI0022E78989|nr:fibronectin type III domain-containing protein [Ligilactobacillus acidipiscis]
MKLDYSLNNKIYIFGDSISKGGSPGKEYGERLQELVGDNIEVINHGLPGRTSGTIGVRQGGISIILGNTQAESLSKDGTPLQVNYTMDPETPYSLSNGTITDIWDNGVNLRFEIIDSKKHLAKISTIDAAENFMLPINYKLPQTSFGSEQYINIIEFGRNDINYTGDYAVDDVKTNYMACVNFLKKTVENPSFIVFSVPAKSTDIKGTDVYKKTKEINDWLAETYPNNFFNARQYLIDHGLKEAGIKPTDADLSAIAGDAVPPSLVAYDMLHPNATAKNILGEALYRFMAQSGMFHTIEKRNTQFLKVIKNGEVIAVGPRGTRNVIVDGLNIGKYSEGALQVIYSNNDVKQLTIRTSEYASVPEFQINNSFAPKVPKFSAVYGSITRTTVKYDIEPAEDEPSAILSYRIYYKKDGQSDSAANYVEFAADGRKKVECELTDLEPSNRYYFAATSINKHGESVRTSWDMHNTLSGVPNTPRVTAVYGSITKNTVQYLFKPNEEDIGGIVSSFIIYWYREIDGQEVVGKIEFPNEGDEVTYLLEKLEPSTTYYFAGSAKNKYGESARTTWDKHNTLDN